MNCSSPSIHDIIDQCCVKYIDINRFRIAQSKPFRHGSSATDRTQSCFFEGDKDGWKKKERLAPSEAIRYAVSVPVNGELCIFWKCLKGGKREEGGCCERNGGDHPRDRIHYSPLISETTCERTPFASPKSIEVFSR